MGPTIIWAHVATINESLVNSNRTIADPAELRVRTQNHTEFPMRYANVVPKGYRYLQIRGQKYPVRPSCGCARGPRQAYTRSRRNDSLPPGRGTNKAADDGAATTPGVARRLGFPFWYT